MTVQQCAQLQGTEIGNLLVIVRSGSKFSHDIFVYDFPLVSIKFSVNLMIRGCELTGWSVWSDCSVTCGKGISSRRREYLDPIRWEKTWILLSQKIPSSFRVREHVYHFSSANIWIPSAQQLPRRLLENYDKTPMNVFLVLVRTAATLSWYRRRCARQIF